MTDALPGTINASIAMTHCMNNSFYPAQFLPPNDDMTVNSARLYTIIIIAGGLLAFLLLCCIVSM